MYTFSFLRTKKVSIPCVVFQQIIGKNSCNLAVIKQATSTQIEIDRHSKQSPNRTITVRYMLCRIYYMYMYMYTCDCTCMYTCTFIMHDFFLLLLIYM